MTIKELGRLIRSFMLEQPFFGHLVMKLKKEIVDDDDKVPTACVTLDPNTLQIKLLYNSNFWEKLTPTQRKGILHHEILHVAFRHLEMIDNYPDMKTANIAMDLEINQIVGDSNLPDDVCSINKEPFKKLNLPPNKGSKFYYDVLMTEQRKEENKALKEFIEKMNQGNHPWSSVGKLTKNQKKLLKNQQDYILKEAVNETGGPKNMGSLPGGLSRELAKLFEKQPEVFNWKAFFRRYVGTMIDLSRKKTFKRPSKRFGVSNPGLRTKRKQKIFLSVDVSGSVSMKELQEVFAQIDYVYKAGAHIDIVTWDGAIQERFVYDGKPPAKVSGGGGSNIGIAIKEFNNNRKDYTFAIHFTDGYVSNNEPLYGKHLFIITSEGQKFDPKGPATMIQIPKQIKNK